MLLDSLGNWAAVNKASSAVLLGHKVMMESEARNVLCFVTFFLVSWSLVRARPDEKGTSVKSNFPTNVFHNKTIITDHHHLEDELRHEMGDVDLDKASEDELEFYYFTMHDFDHNKLLDGLEIIAALHDSLDEHIGNVFTMDEKMKHYIDMTDEVLKEDDLDKDGFLSFVEYMHSQNRVASPTTILDKTAKEKGSKS